MNEIENVQELYPLVKKYNAPIAATEGGVRFSRDEDERNAWFKTLPWDEDEFWGVFGCCTQNWYGALFVRHRGHTLRLGAWVAYSGRILICSKQSTNAE